MASRLRWQRVAVGSIPVRHPQAELRFLLGYVFFYIALSGVTAQLILRWPQPLFGSPDFLLDYWYFLFFKITFLLVVPASVFWGIGYRWRDLAYPRLSGRDYLGAAVALAVGFSINLSYFSELQRQTQSGTIPDAGLRITVAALIALVNAGIPEEFVFRYWLQTRLEARFGRALAIVGTAVLFTAWHIPSRYFLAFGSEGRAGSLASVAFHTGVPVFAVGLVLGLLWDRYRRLLPLIGLHWGIDILPLVAAAMGIKH